MERGPVEIVQLSPENWSVLRELEIRSLEQESIAFEDQELGMKRNLSRTPEFWKSRLDENTSPNISVFAKDGDQFIGMVSAVIYKNYGYALIRHLYVDKQGHRGLGIGRNLLESLLAKLRATQDIWKAKLFVVETQDAARSLYESLGFRETGRHQAKRGNEVYTEIEMELDIIS